MNLNEAGLMRKIQEFDDLWIPKPSRTLSQSQLEKAAFSTWALDEITYRLIDEMSRLPPHITGRLPVSYFDIIEEFISEMDYMSDTTTDYHKRFIFLVASETGTELLMFLKGDL